MHTGRPVQCQSRLATQAGNDGLTNRAVSDGCLQRMVKYARHTVACTDQKLVLQAHPERTSDSLGKAQSREAAMLWHAAGRPSSSHSGSAAMWSSAARGPLHALTASHPVCTAPLAAGSALRAQCGCPPARQSRGLAVQRSVLPSAHSPHTVRAQSAAARAERSASKAALDGSVSMTCGNAQHGGGRSDGTGSAAPAPTGPKEARFQQVVTAVEGALPCSLSTSVCSTGDKLSPLCDVAH